jgi:hypothetical protein
MFGRSFKVQVIAILLTAASVVSIGWYIHDRIYDKGFTACKTANDKAVAERKETARDKIVKDKGDYDNEKREISKQGDSGFGVGARTSDAIDRLRNRHGE